MAKYLIAALSFLLVATAENAAFARQDFEQTIAGQWRVDAAKTRTYLKLPSPASDAEEDFLKEVGKLSVEFGPDHLISVRDSDNEQMKGQWKLVSEEDALVTIDLIRDEEATRATIEFLDNGSVAITTQNERPLVFTRVGKDSVEGIAANLIGVWECDRNATKSLESNKEFTAEQIDEMMQQAGAMVVSFAADGKYSATTLDGDNLAEFSGTWTVSGIDDAKKTFQLSLEAEVGPHTLDVELRNDGGVRFSPAGQPSAIFVRKPDKLTKQP